MLQHQKDQEDKKKKEPEHTTNMTPQQVERLWVKEKTNKARANIPPEKLHQGARTPTSVVVASG